MPVIKIGKPSNFYGKKVFEILVNLKSFGIGRILERISTTQKHNKKTFYIIKDVRPQMDPELTFGYLYCDFYYKEQKVPGTLELLPYRPDFRLVPKYLEDEYLKIVENAPILGQVPEKVLPRNCQVPPLMAEVINRGKLPQPPCLYIKGLTKDSYGYDHESLAQLKIPYEYDLNDLEKLTCKIEAEN